MQTPKDWKITEDKRLQIPRKTTSYREQPARMLLESRIDVSAPPLSCILPLKLHKRLNPLPPRPEPQPRGGRTEIQMQNSGACIFLITLFIFIWRHQDLVVALEILDLSFLR